MLKIFLAFFILFHTIAFSATLVGYWNFEEGSGSQAKDSSGNNLNGTLYNVGYTQGRVGNYAATFNGSNSFVEVLNNSLLTPNTISISLWFKAGASQVQYADILDKGHGAGTNPYYAGYVLQYDDASHINGVYGNGSSFYGIADTNNDKDNTWHHIVMVLGATEISLYRDGILIGKTAGAGPLVENGSNLYFGRHRTLGRYFNGALDDIQIYNGALTQSEVSLLSTGATTIPEANSIGLLLLTILGYIIKKRSL